MLCMQRIVVLLLLCCLTCTVNAVQITEFCPDPYQTGDPDEYLVLEGTGSLEGFVVSDGEGGFRFPAGTRIDGRLIIARNGPAFGRTYGFLPDLEVYDYSQAVPDVIRSGTFQMANGADELLLYRGTTLIQQVSWPADVHPREGQIHYLEEGAWDPRPLLIGQSRLQPATFDDVAVTAFVAPDCSYEIFSSAVARAGQEILVNVYEFTDPAMAADLIRARERGVAVTVLLEGGPVGGISAEERAIAGALNRSGIPVLQMTTTDAAHARYRYDHAKYVVVDDEAVLVTTENFKPGGFPAPGLMGNRGWGVYLEDPDLAAYFADLFSLDSRGGDIIPLEGSAGETEAPYAPPYDAEFSAFRAEGARVTPVLAPDTSHLVLEMLDEARTSIAIEQAYITNQTTFELDPYLATAINASRRGVAVRVLLDAAWFNTEGDADNDEMVRIINRIAAAEGLPLEAQLADLEANNQEKVHTKGVVVDGHTVLVGSINWNANSPAFNREAGVIIEHPDIGEYFTRVFLDDWNAAAPGNEGGGPGYAIDPLKIAIAACIVAGLSILYVRRHRR
jgi:cardiolipin synthase